MAAPYRADQVGSLLRPREVLDAHAAYAQGKLPQGELRHIEDTAILAALELQQQTGVDVFSDGEYRRGGWASDFTDSVDGYVPGAAPISMQWAMPDGTPRQGIGPGPGGGSGGPVSRVIGEKLRQKRRLTADEEGFLKQHAPGPFKITMPAASYVVARGYKPGVSDKAYPRRADALVDAASIIRAEVR